MVVDPTISEWAELKLLGTVEVDYQHIYMYLKTNIIRVYNCICLSKAR